MDKLGQTIALRRQQLGMTIESLAKEAGLSMSALSNIERGLQEPRVSTIIKLAKALHISPADIILEAAD